MIDALYQDEEFEPFTGPSVEDEITARTLLVEYHRNERRMAEIQRIRECVDMEYDNRVRAIFDRQQAVREMLRLYVLDHGAVSFPDVGGAHVTQRKPAPRVTDPAKLLAWAHLRAATYIETTERVPAKLLPDLVKNMGGELPDGVEVHHPEPTVTIKGRQ